MAQHSTVKTTDHHTDPSLPIYRLPGATLSALPAATETITSPFFGEAEHVPQKQCITASLHCRMHAPRRLRKEAGSRVKGHTTQPPAAHAGLQVCNTHATFASSDIWA
jgi:hypothetical protein